MQTFNAFTLLHVLRCLYSNYYISAQHQNLLWRKTSKSNDKPDCWTG